MTGSKPALGRSRTAITAARVGMVIDGMGRRDGCADLVRIIRGERGRVAVRMELVIRCEYGSIIPWVRRLDDGRLTAVAGPDRLTLSDPTRLMRLTVPA